MKKCPACGQPIESFATRCPNCGMELKADGAANSLVKFTEKLDEMEGGRKIQLPHNNDVKEKKKIGFTTIILWCFLWPFYLLYYMFKIFPFLIKTATNVYREPNFDATDRRKQQYIINAPVPNNREDLMEFALLCSNKIEEINYLQLLNKKSGEINAWNSVWVKKLNLIIEKAKIAMKDDKDTLNEIIEIQTDGNAKLQENRKRIINVLIATGVLIVILLLFIIIAGLQ